MNQNVAILAGRAVDFSVLNNQEQQSVANFVDNLKLKKMLNSSNPQKSLHLADLFELVKIDLPKDFKINRNEALNSKKIPQFGSTKGKIIINDDFDEPLADFADYMPTQG